MRGRMHKAVLVAGVVALPTATVGQDVPLRVQAAVQSQRVFVGQQFLLQIQIRGSDDPDPVDIGPLEADFSVTEAGGGSSNSTSVSIVNGQMTRQVQHGYNLNYRLAARRAGQVRIPSLTVTANGNQPDSPHPTNSADCPATSGEQRLQVQAIALGEASLCRAGSEADGGVVHR